MGVQSAFLAPAEDLVKQFGVALEIVQYLRWSESRLDVFGQARLIRRRVDAVGDAIHAADYLLTALGKHEVDEQTRRVGMRRLGGDTSGVNIGKDRI